LSGGLDNKIILWNLSSISTPLRVFEISKQVTAVAFVPDVNAYTINSQVSIL